MTAGRIQELLIPAARSRHVGHDEERLRADHHQSSVESPGDEDPLPGETRHVRGSSYRAVPN
jgi:hypothetical protein